jgi:glycosidase
MLADTLKSIYSIYPKAVCDSLMNILGTHDTERALTVFGKGSSEVSWEKGSVLATKRLSARQRSTALRRMKLGAAIQYTVYGVPSLYYGDEAGLEGYHDPFCRLPYPWGNEDTALLDFYVKLGQIRARCKEIFAVGEFRILYAENGVIVFERYTEKESILVIANASKHTFEYESEAACNELLSGKIYGGKVGSLECAILKRD